VVHLDVLLPRVDVTGADEVEDKSIGLDCALISVQVDCARQSFADCELWLTQPNVERVGSAD